MYMCARGVHRCQVADIGKVLGAKINQLYVHGRLQRPHVKEALTAIAEALHKSDNCLAAFEALVSGNATMSSGQESHLKGAFDYQDLRKGLWNVLKLNPEVSTRFKGGASGPMMTDLVLAFDTDWSGTVDRSGSPETLASQ